LPSPPHPTHPPTPTPHPIPPHPNNTHPPSRPPPQGASLLFDGYLTPWLCRYERKLDTLLEVGAQIMVSELEGGGGGTGRSHW